METLSSVVLILYVLTGEVPEKFMYPMESFEACVELLDIKSQELANEYEATVIGFCVPEENVKV